eukprot:SAG31_NODE_21353_length_551_cov_7.809735_1_plen_51_part_01
MLGGKFVPVLSWTGLQRGLDCGTAAASRYRLAMTHRAVRNHRHLTRMLSVI